MIKCDYSNYGVVIATWVDGKFNWGQKENVAPPQQWKRYGDFVFKWSETLYWLTYGNFIS